MFANDSPKPTGQALGELDLGGSSYGKELVRVFGSVKIEANLTWIGNVRKTITHQEAQGGKGFGGGGGGTDKTSYSGEFGVQLCKGPIVGVAQLWRDNNLLYSAHEYTTDAGILSAAGFLPYLSNYAGMHYGTDDQLPDPLKAQRLAPGLPYSANGYVNYDNLCSADRGIAHIVFNDLGFNDGRVPSIQGEVCCSPDAYIEVQPNGVYKVFRGTGHPIRDVIETMLFDAGILARVIDIDDAITGKIYGLKVSAASRRETLLKLIQAHDIGFVESGYDFKFFPLYRPVSLNIPFTDFGTAEGRANKAELYPFSETKNNDLPYQVDIQFTTNNLVSTGTAGLGMNYDECTQSAKRNISPNVTTVVYQADLREFTMSPADASRIANKQLYRAWNFRLNLQPAKLPRKYLKMEPGDLFSTTYAGYTTAFYVKKVTIGKDYTVELEAQQYSQLAAASTSEGSLPLGNKVSQTPMAGDMRFYAMNLPALRSVDAEKGGVYLTASWIGGGSNPAKVYTSRNGGDTWGVNGMSEALVLAPNITGAVALATPDGTIAGYDTVTTIVVDLHQPDSLSRLENVTEDDLINGMNMFLVGVVDAYNSKPPYLNAEIMQATDVSLNGDRTQATFSNFLRGRKGTEWFVDQHVADETFVWLSGTGMTFFPTQSQDIGRNRKYQIVGAGLQLNGEGTVTIDFTPLQNNMIPLNPRFFTLSEDPITLDFTVAFYRRTRYPVEILSATGVPCGETVETYRLMFFDALGVRVMLRDFTPSTQLKSPVVFQYTVAMRLADFGSATFDLSGYSIKVCMLSTLAGEGNITVYPKILTK